MVPTVTRAAVIRQLGDTTELTAEYPLKQPSQLAPGNVLVCHSDLHWMAGELMLRPRLPSVGGHEGVGNVVAIGANTINDSIKIGDRVGVKYVMDTCGRCGMCRSGLEQHCAEVKTAGFRLDGTFAEYVVGYVDHLVPIPKELSSAAAAPILCAGVTVYKALKQSNTTAGNWIVITGAGGGLGHLAVQYAVAMGLRVAAVDTGEKKRKLCLDLGVEKWIDFKESNVVEVAGEIAPEAVLVLTPIIPTYIQAVQYVRPHGTVVCVGIPSESLSNFSLELMIFKGVKLVGTLFGNYQDALEALDFAARGKVRPHYHERPIEEINSGLHSPFSRHLPHCDSAHVVRSPSMYERTPGVGEMPVLCEYDWEVHLTYSVMRGSRRSTRWPAILKMNLHINHEECRVRKVGLHDPKSWELDLEELTKVARDAITVLRLQSLKASKLFKLHLYANKYFGTLSLCLHRHVHSRTLRVIAPFVHMSFSDGVPTVTRAAVIRQLGDTTELTAEYPLKQPSQLAPGNVSVCHSDLHWMAGEWRLKPRLPSVGGHEGVGNVVAIGANTINDSIKIGDRVGVKYILDTCGRCSMCRSGLDQHCPKVKTAGFGSDGTFAEYVVAYVDHLVPIPKELTSAAAAPILDFVGPDSIQRVEAVQYDCGDWVAITGAGGGLGHLAVQYAVAMGLRVVAIDTGDKKRKLCLDLGVEKWIDFKESNVVEVAGKIAPHAVLVLTPIIPAYIQAVQYVRPHGTVVCVGLPSEPLSNFSLELMIFKGVKLVGTLLGNYQNTLEALDFAARGKVRPHYHERPIEEINSVMAELRAGHMLDVQW
ncbi:Alcohol dehydrogenase 3 [Grifola frondosa]|uniref:alcohol dehydrogenase n=1 Tax=Grifola frondosa TaxID=5627 RepID=A0A1C7MNK8_GRIFR|nr:Alcohol dehydrogenase 3 [Grifola frondosa]